jgi:tetratricopeptide (TPR) repeat protein
MDSSIAERLVWLGVWLLLSAPVGGAWGQGSSETRGGAVRPRLAAEATLHYIAGIEALEAADFQHAIASLTQAIDLDEDNADYYRARGVAHTLAEDFPAALADLHRADRLRQGGDQEARL